MTGIEERERMYTDAEVVELIERGLQMGVILDDDHAKEYTISELERMVTQVQ